MRRSVGAGGGVVLALWPRPSTRCWIRKDRRQLRSERHSTVCEPAPPESDRPSKAGRRTALARGRSTQRDRHGDRRRAHTHQHAHMCAAAPLLCPVGSLFKAADSETDGMPPTFARDPATSWAPFRMVCLPDPQRPRSCLAHSTRHLEKANTSPPKQKPCSRRPQRHSHGAVSVHALSVW